MLPELEEVAALVPAEEEDLIQGVLEGTLLNPHVVDLIEDGHGWEDVHPEVVMSHSSNHVNLINNYWAEAILVNCQSIVIIYASFNSKKELVGQVKPPVQLSLVN
jgi:hypothetical protein